MEVGNYSIGTQFDSTEGKTIGEGTFGKVCKAVHRVLGHEVAVKILEKQRINDQQDIERIRREITILQMLHYPSVVQLYEIIESETQLYLFMEYASGGELFEYIDKVKRVQEIEACKFFHQIIGAMQYIHGIHIVHRDLKPENILLTPMHDVLIVDFGLSNTYTDTLKTACGSPCYAAPEMIQGKPYHGLHTDVWSCGVILYAMLCGYLPFEDSNTQTLYKKILTADFHIPRFVSADAKDLIRHILTVNPEERYTIDQIISHKWWQLCKQDNPLMNPFKEAYHHIPISLQPGSIFAESVKRNVSEDVQTCDTAQQSVGQLEKCFSKQQYEEEDQQLKYQIELIKEEIEPLIEDSSPLLLISHDRLPSRDKSDKQDSELLIPSLQAFNESMRSLTRQKSNQSLQNSRVLVTQCEPELIEAIFKPVVLVVPKKITPKPAMPSAYKRALVNKPINKLPGSMSTHETNTTKIITPIPKVKTYKSPVTPVVNKSKEVHKINKLQTEGSTFNNTTVSFHRTAEKKITAPRQIMQPPQTTPKTTPIHKPCQSLQIQQPLVVEDFQLEQDGLSQNIQRFTNRLNTFSNQIHLHSKMRSIHIQEAYKQLEVHNGPVNLSLVSSKDPKMLVNGLHKYLQQKQIPNQIDNYCIHIGQQTNIKVKKVMNLELFVLQFEPISEQSQHIAQDIINNFKL